jgi:ABC-2 type transport system ATP-binding protein
MTAVVVTRGLTKRFGEVTAVDDLDVTVRRGEVFGFLGPNGSGKTTTIRLLLAVLRPTSGTAEVLGGSPRDPEVRARIGFLPAELNLDPRHTAMDTIGFLGALRGGFRAQDVKGLLERFDLDPGRRIGELSTGNRRKVGVVQAFAGRPELLILDEPTSGLDPLLQYELISLVEERVADGATVFMSSHVLPEVERVARRVGILRRGRLVRLGSVDEVRATARHRLELHLGSPADPAPFQNLPGVVEADAEGRVLRITVEGSVDPVVKQAARLEVHRIVSHDTDLEDAFRELYK